MATYLFSFAIISNIAFAKLKFVNKVGAKIENRILEFMQMTQLIFRLKNLNFMFHCENVSLTDFYKRILKFMEKVSENGRTINNLFLGTVDIISLGTCNLSKIFLIYWSIILTG